jgi:hypothetical protein
VIATARPASILEQVGHAASTSYSATPSANTVRKPCSLTTRPGGGAGSEGKPRPSRYLVEITRTVQGVESLLGRAFRSADGDVHAVVHLIQVGEQKEEVQKLGRLTVKARCAFGSEQAKVLLANEGDLQDQLVWIIWADELTSTSLNHR